MQKTVVVAVNYAVWVPKYKVYEKRVSRHMVGTCMQSVCMHARAKACC